MKLATYKDGSRDGQLVVVSRDLTQAHYATAIANTLQQALDDWSFIAPQLEDLAVALNQGRARHAFAFDAAMCMAPLPRAFQWADGSAYLNHVELVRRARHAVVPEQFYTDPLMYQGGSDDFIGPRDAIVVADEAYGIDFESEIAVVTGDVAMSVTAEEALESVRLVMLANDVSLRHLIPDELAKGFGFVNGKPSTGFSPVAVTLDELGDMWQGGRLHAHASGEDPEHRRRRRDERRFGLHGQQGSQGHHRRLRRLRHPGDNVNGKAQSQGSVEGRQG